MANPEALKNIPGQQNDVQEALLKHEQVADVTEGKLANLADDIAKKNPQQKLPPEYAQLLRGQTGAS